MSDIRIRARSSIADAERARAAVVDLPTVSALRRPHTPRTLLRAIASFRRTVEPERVIIMTLAPVRARSRR